MKELNRILIQLDKAIEFANSDLENEKKLAVILFDNLIEIQLLNKIKDQFIFDETSWFTDKRKYSSKDRFNATRYIDCLLYTSDAADE